MSRNTRPLLTEQGIPVEATQLNLWTLLPAADARLVSLDPEVDTANYVSSAATAITENPAAFGEPPFELSGLAGNVRHPDVTTLAFVNDAGAVLGAVSVYRKRIDTAELIMLFRLRAAAYQELGRRLLRAALMDALQGGARRITLDVLEDNANAAAIYTQAGFRVYARSQEPRGALMMELCGRKTIRKAISSLVADLS